MRLEVSGSSYDSAAEALYGANQVAAMAYDRLKDKLAGYHALGGDDTSSEDFVSNYDEAAQGAVDALRALVEGLGNLGDVTFASVQNHRRANAESVYGRPRPTYEGGVPGDGPVEVAAFTPPSSLGGDNEDMPDWWNHVVDHLQGFGWPSANTDQLRDAASAWESAAVHGRRADRQDRCRGLHARDPALARDPDGHWRCWPRAAHVADLATQLRALGSACHDYAHPGRRDPADDQGPAARPRRRVRGQRRHRRRLSFFTFGGAGAVAAGVIAARAVKYAHLHPHGAARPPRGPRRRHDRRSIPAITPGHDGCAGEAEAARAPSSRRTAARVSRQGRGSRGARTPQQLRNLKRYQNDGCPAARTPTRECSRASATARSPTPPRVPGNVPGSVRGVHQDRRTRPAPPSAYVKTHLRAATARSSTSRTR